MVSRVPNQVPNTPAAVAAWQARARIRLSPFPVTYRNDSLLPDTANNASVSASESSLADSASGVSPVPTTSMIHPLHLWSNDFMHDFLGG